MSNIMFSQTKCVIFSTSEDFGFVSLMEFSGLREGTRFG